MSLRIYPPDGHVKISAPLGFSTHLIQQHLEAKRDWLHRHRARLQTLPVTPATQMETGEIHYFLGKPLKLLLVKSTEHKEASLLQTDILLLPITPHATTSARKALLNQWYHSQMQQQVQALMTPWQTKIGVSVNEWGIKSMKTRWGSCNVRIKRIWLNLILIQKPLICLEYVLVHELVHLLEASHNARFHRLMDEFLPDWPARKKILSHT